jgi:hypothetical protein
MPRYSVEVGPVRLYGGRERRPMTVPRAVLWCLLGGPLAVAVGVMVIVGAPDVLTVVVALGIVAFGLALIGMLIAAIVRAVRR